LKALITASVQSVRLKQVLDSVGGRGRWYRQEAASRRPAPPVRPSSRRGPLPKEITPWERHVVETVARSFPWYGYKKITLICQRLDEPLSRRKVYRIMKEAGLLHQRKRRIEERARQDLARLHQLLPQAPNELWQMDVTYIPVPGYGWRYAITVIDYYSRYLLALHFTHSYSAVEAARALHAAVSEAERHHGPLPRPVFLVTDNGPSFIARRFRDELDRVRIASIGVSAFSQVRIGYRMPTQLGLLERFHETLKQEEVYWNVYADPWDASQKLAVFHERYNVARPHWALVAAETPAPPGATDPSRPPAHILSPYEVYVKGYKVNPPPWSRWVGWLEKDQDNPAQPSNRNPVRVSA
jgi:putative transposase